VEPAGRLMIHNVPVLCAGVWVDSWIRLTTRTPLLLLLLLLLLLYSSRLAFATPSSNVRSDEPTVRLNWGAIFREVDTAHVLTTHWAHTLSIKLPTRPRAIPSRLIACFQPPTPYRFPFQRVPNITSDAVFIPHSANAQDPANCTVVQPLVAALHRLQKESGERLLKVVNQIHRLFPSNHRLPPARRRARGCSI
jgi:hypothetical protein